jgi:hypothetical protein
MPETKPASESSEEIQILVCAKLISEASGQAKKFGIDSDVFVKTMIVFIASAFSEILKDEDWEEVLSETIKHHMDEIERSNNARN